MSQRRDTIHTERIIERSIGIWSEWLGHWITSVKATALCDSTDIEEIQIELSAAQHPYYISWQQEDGATDDTLFHWLSMQRTSHFKEGRLKCSTPPPALERLQGSPVERIELYGRSDLDMIVAAVIIVQGSGIGLATARDLANKGRFSRFGVAGLVVADEDRLRRELSLQSMERIAELRAGSA